MIFFYHLFQLKDFFQYLILINYSIEYSHKKLGRKSENCSNNYNIKKHKKRPTNNDLIVAYASRYKARLTYK